MNVATTMYFKRGDAEIETTITASIQGARGRIEEIYDIEAKCACGAAFEMTKDEEYSAEERLLEVAYDILDDARERSEG